MLPPIKTPCIKVCVVDGASGYCLGCGRTLNEIAKWARLSEAERDQVIDLLAPRMTTLRASGKLG
jgi:uncharacterized protein